MVTVRAAEPLDGYVLRLRFRDPPSSAGSESAETPERWYGRTEPTSPRRHSTRWSLRTFAPLRRRWAQAALLIGSSALSLAHLLPHAPVPFPRVPEDG